MIRTAFIFLILIIFPYTSYAQGPETFCHLLPDHEPDQGAAYKPGVDVHGNPVAPADLNAPPLIVPDVVRIPLNVDLAQGLSQPLPDGTELNTHMGMLEIYRNGSVVFNGQDLTRQANILCGRAVEPEVKPPPQPPVKPGATQVPLPEQKIQAETPKEEILWGEGY